MLHRLSQLHLGDASLCFGRIDSVDDPTPYYIGRIAVSDDQQIRRPLAGPGGRAVLPRTGSHDMGLARRRHFATRGRGAVDLEDECRRRGRRPGPDRRPQRHLGLTVP